jgi:hypothetical protein
VKTTLMKKIDVKDDERTIEFWNAIDIMLRVPNLLRWTCSKFTNE